MSRSFSNYYLATADRLATMHSDASGIVEYLDARRADGTPWATILADVHAWGLVLSEQTAQNWLSAARKAEA